MLLGRVTRGHSAIMCLKLNKEGCEYNYAKLEHVVSFITLSPLVVILDRSHLSKMELVLNGVEPAKLPK